MNSFIRKYSATIDLEPEDLRKLFQFRPVTIDHPLVIYGAEITFFYGFHSIPCLGFNLAYEGLSLYFSGDTLIEEFLLAEARNHKVITSERLQDLVDRNLHKHTMIFHQVGQRHLQSCLETLAGYPEEVKQKMHLYNIAESDMPPGCGLKRVKCGLSNSLVSPG
jgi:hypothetical protein